MGGRRGAAAGVLAVVAAAALAGCSGDSSRLISVSFRLDPSTHVPPPAVVAAARKACPGNSDTPLEPPTTSQLLSVRQHPLRYGATDATDREIQQLSNCLLQVPGVLQATLEDQDY